MVSYLNLLIVDLRLSIVTYSHLCNIVSLENLILLGYIHCYVIRTHMYTIEMLTNNSVGISFQNNETPLDVSNAGDVNFEKDNKIKRKIQELLKVNMHYF